MTTTLQKIGLAMITTAGLAIGTAGAANADWDHGRHRGWEQLTEDGAVTSLMAVIALFAAPCTSIASARE